MPSFEVLLVIGVVGFYLFDSAMLLYANEFILIETNRRWDFAYPGSGWQIMKKSLYLPNPLRPDSAAFRVFWLSNERNEQQDDEQALSQFTQAYRSLRYMLMSLFVLLLVMIPLVLFWFGSGAELLLVFALIYVNIIIMLVQIFRSREALEVPRRFFLSLAFEALACAPFALNLLRKISLHRSLSGDPLRFAARVFEKDTYHQLIDAVCNKVDEQLEIEDTQRESYSELQTYRDQLAGMKQ